MHARIIEDQYLTSQLVDGRILFAEDEPLIALSLQDALEQAGFRVDHVVAGADALAALETHQADLSGLITDIRLGGDVNGWVIARAARELVPHLPVVYISGDSAHEHTAHGVPDSVMLQKPFAAAQLVTAIATLLNAVPPTQPS
jgi:DNA-binding response OmpR family regulator